MAKYSMSLFRLKRFHSELTDCLDAFRDKADDWQSDYDDRSCNEPEYDSQIDAWQERLDTLEEVIDNLTMANDDCEHWLDELEADVIDERDGEASEYEAFEFDFDEDGLDDIVGQYEDVAGSKRGLTKQLKNLKTQVMALKYYKKPEQN